MALLLSAITVNPHKKKKVAIDPDRVFFSFMALLVLFLGDGVGVE